LHLRKFIEKHSSIFQFFGDTQKLYNNWLGVTEVSTDMTTDVIVAVIGATATIVAALIAVSIKRGKDRQRSEANKIGKATADRGAVQVVGTVRDVNISSVASPPRDDIEPPKILGPDAAPKWTLRIQTDAGRTYTFEVNPDANIAWVVAQAVRSLTLKTEVEVGQDVILPLKLRWVLVDTRIKSEWESLSLDRKLGVHAALKTDEGIRYVHDNDKRISEIGMQSGMQFRLYLAPVEESYIGPSAVKASSAGRLS